MSMTARARTNLNDLSAEDLRQLSQDTYAKESYFQQLFQGDNTELDCVAITQAFREQIGRILLEKDIIKTPHPLEELHLHVSEEMKAYNFNDGVNKISTYFYDTDAAFMNVYHDFIRYLRTHFVKEAFWFQATPTIRIHCPNGENNHHYPRYHTDVGYGHPPEEMNLWFPLTSLLTGHGFRIMSFANSKMLLEKFNYDFSSFIQSAIDDKAFSAYCDSLSQPVTTELGRVLAFDSRCVHTGEPLKVHTRISMDIRILPVAQYEKMDIEYQGAGRRKILFTPGHGYHEHNSDHLLKLKGI